MCDTRNGRGTRRVCWARPAFLGRSRVSDVLSARAGVVAAPGGGNAHAAPDATDGARSPSVLTNASITSPRPRAAQQPGTEERGERRPGGLVRHTSPGEGSRRRRGRGRTSLVATQDLLLVLAGEFSDAADGCSAVSWPRAVTCGIPRKKKSLAPIDTHRAPDASADTPGPDRDSSRAGQPDFLTAPERAAPLLLSAAAGLAFLHVPGRTTPRGEGTSGPLAGAEDCLPPFVHTSHPPCALCDRRAMWPSFCMV